MFLDKYCETNEKEDSFEDEELRCWYSSSKNQTVLIKDMDTIYIENSIKMLNGIGKTKPHKSLLDKKDIYLKWFSEELQSRKT